MNRISLMRAGTILVPISLLLSLTACGGGGSSSFYGSPPINPVPVKTPVGVGTPKPVVTPTPVGVPGPVGTPNPVGTPTPVGVPGPVGTPVGVTPTPVPTPVPTPAPTLAPVPGSVVLNPSSLSFTAVGPSYAMSVAISEVNYVGTWTTTDTCAGIATVSSVLNASFSVTPVAAGTCNVVVSDSLGKSTNLPVSVTTTAVTIN